MVHAFARMSLLVYFSMLLMALFFLTGTMKNLWTTASILTDQNDALIAQMERDFPEMVEDEADALNAIEPAAGR